LNRKLIGRIAHYKLFILIVAIYSYSSDMQSWIPSLHEYSISQ